MVVKSYSSERQGDVAVVDLGNGFTEVWLRRSHEQDTVDDGPDGEQRSFWVCDEVNFTVAGHMGAEEAAERFDELWAEHERDGMSAEDIAREAAAAAAEAKEIASSAGQDPAVASFIALSLPSIAPTVKDSALAPVIKYAGEYVPDGHEYKKGEVFRCPDGTYWRVSQTFTTQAQWSPGSPGLDALFYEIKIAADGIIVWAQPRGEFDAPDAGDLRHYPDADGAVYRSKVNGNGYSPEAAPGNWEAA